MANSPIIYGPNGATALPPGGITLPASTSGNVQILPAATTTPYTLTLPNAAPGILSALTMSTSGTIAPTASLQAPQGGTGNTVSPTPGQFLKGRSAMFSLSNYVLGNINYIGNGLGEAATVGWSGVNWQTAVTVTIASPAVFTVSSTTGYFVNLPISFTTTGALPTGLTANTTYYVSAVVSGTTFRVSATRSGSSINTSGTQSGTHKAYPLQPINVTAGTATGLTFSSGSTSLRTSGFTIVQSNSTIVGGVGFSYNFNTDPSDEGNPLCVYLEYNASNTFVNQTSFGQISDLQIAIFDRTAGIVSSFGPVNFTQNGSNNFRFAGIFTPSVDTAYSLVIFGASMSANSTGWTFQFTNIYIGPDLSLLGNPSARYYGSNTALSSSDTTIVWNTMDYDPLYIMNFSTGVMIIPFTGKWRILSKLRIFGTFLLNITSSIKIRQNGSVLSADTSNAGGAISADRVTVSDILALNGGDQVDIVASTNATSPGGITDATTDVVSIQYVGQ